MRTPASGKEECFSLLSFLLAEERVDHPPNGGEAGVSQPANALALILLAEDPVGTQDQGELG